MRLFASSCLLRAVLFSLPVLALSACGGGSDGSGGRGRAEQQGVFVDHPVEGLQFVTPSRAGLTNRQGGFRYLSGESVRFLIGGIELGSAAGQAVLTPLNLPMPATARSPTCCVCCRRWTATATPAPASRSAPPRAQPPPAAASTSTRARTISVTIPRSPSSWPLPTAVSHWLMAARRAPSSSARWITWRRTAAAPTACPRPAPART
jgi:hypothetical protein